MSLAKFALQTSRHPCKKRITDPFQVFCAEKRPEITALYPDESVGRITSILASKWRTISTDKKIMYAELARKFDLLQQRGLPPGEEATYIKSKLIIPFIHVLQRNGLSPAVREASLHLLDRDFQK
jgi:hypothetical protein